MIQEGVVFLPLPNESAVRRVPVWCPALQRMVEMKGSVEAHCGLETVRVTFCVQKQLGCPCLKNPLKRGLCMVGKELTANKW